MSIFPRVLRFGEERREKAKRQAAIFSQATLALIAAGLAVATIAGAEQLAPAADQAVPANAGHTVPATPRAATSTVGSTLESAPAPQGTAGAAATGEAGSLARWATPPRLADDRAKSPAGTQAVPAPAGADSAPDTSEESRLETTTASPPAPPTGPAPASAAKPASSSASIIGPAAPALPAAAAAAEETAKTQRPAVKPAKLFFGAVKEPAPLAARAIGTYARGCLSGGEALPVDGPSWQAMRLSRNRNWGHPKLIALVEKLAADGKSKDGWPGLLVGDLAQPRGGPMLTGHASHQIGLDADIWLTPMPDRRLTSEERETIEATSMLSEDGLAVSRDRWTAGHLNIIKRAASYAEVERVLVHPAIKQVLCHEAGSDREWLSKVRPYWGHHYHFHVRIRCPAGSALCEPQKPVTGEDGCGKELDDWLKLIAKITPETPPLPIPPPIAAKPPPEKPGLTLEQLPSECRVVLTAGNPAMAAEIADAAKAASKAAEPATKTAAAKPKDPSGTKPAEPTALKAAAPRPAPQ